MNTKPKLSIFCFSNNKLNNDTVNKLISNRWLSKNDVWHYLDDAEIEALRNDSSAGIIPSKMNKIRTAYGDGVVLIDVPFIGNVTEWKKGNFFAMSLGNFSTDTSIILQLALHLLKFRASQVLKCNQDCFINTRNASYLSICRDCNRKLNNKYWGLELLRIHIMLDLIKTKVSKTKIAKIFSADIGEYAISSNLDLDAGASIIAASHSAIDYIIRDGSIIRRWLQARANGLYSAKKLQKKGYQQRINKNPYPYLIACRRWNSWTPSQPINLPPETILQHQTGGGYLISDGINFIAIDPGYGFLDMLYRHHNIHVSDLSAIIVSHDHPDHISELQNILSLRYIYSQNNLPLRIFLNPSTFYLYERLLDYYHLVVSADSPIKINSNLIIRIDTTEIKALQVIHNEIYNFAFNSTKEKVGRSSSYGFSVKGISPNGTKFCFAIPGDTSFPKKISQIEAFKSFFGSADISALHLGSLEEEWRNIQGSMPASSIAYGNKKHLGLNGVVNMVNLLQSKVCVITEFGEELDSGDTRLSVAKIIKELSLNSNSCIIPSDVKLHLVKTKDDVLFKCSCGKFVPVKHLESSIGHDKLINYSYPAGCKNGLRHVELS